MGSTYNNYSAGMMQKMIQNDIPQYHDIRDSWKKLVMWIKTPFQPF